MSDVQTVILGAIAGLTIFLGLPVARLKTERLGPRAFLNALSAGILVFLLIDIFEHAVGPIEGAVEEHAWGQLASFGSALVLGIGLGLVGIAYLVDARKRRARDLSLGPGAMAATEAPLLAGRESLSMAMTIAVGIGLHNFSEGLAIGQAAGAGELSLATLLVIGFGLHNATEGFGIVGPMVATGERPSWRWLLGAGLVAGGPTFLGTVVGISVSSEFVFVSFLALAAGAILYVIGEMLGVGRRLSPVITAWGILVGITLAFATELVIEAAGG
jgi:ZIP family zinc transporter